MDAQMIWLAVILAFNVGLCFGLILAWALRLRARREHFREAAEKAYWHSVNADNPMLEALIELEEKLERGDFDRN